MSESSAHIQSSLSGPAGLGQGYKLSDDLAQLCLPHEWKDSCRTLAWVNSVCLLFLVVGLVGLKPPKVVHKPLREVAEVTPVVLTPQEEVPKTEPDVKPPEQEQPKETTDTPQVATVVAVENSSAVPFAVPVQGAVVVASEARLATPPPVAPRPTGPTFTSFNAGGDGVAGGHYPPPDYSIQAQRRGNAGTVVVHIHVNSSGEIASVDLFKPSGYSLLDQAAIEVVKRHWRFPPGKERYFEKPFEFRPPDR